MTVDLSFIHDPDWREERERQWAEYEVKESDHYTKRQLECRKRYFMDAELLCQDNEKHRIRDGALLTMYPLKTPEAWEYICRELMQGIRAPGERGGGYYSLLHGLVESVTGEMGRGWSYHEQCVLFEWLLGDTFRRVIAPPVPIGTRGLQPKHVLDPNRLFRAALTWVSRWLKEEVNRQRPPVWVSKMNYLMSLIPLVDERVFNIEKYDRNVRTKKGIVIVDLQAMLQRILSYMQEYEPEGVTEEAIVERRQFLEEFRQRIEQLDPMPRKLNKLLRHMGFEGFDNGHGKVSAVAVRAISMVKKLTGKG